MNIYDDRVTKVKFEELCVGEGFIYQGNYYIKTDIVTSLTNTPSDDDIIYNSVSLANGEHRYFGLTMPVEAIDNVKLVIIK